jgi:hypothetical protein
MHSMSSRASSSVPYCPILIKLGSLTSVKHRVCHLLVLQIVCSVWVQTEVRANGVRFPAVATDSFFSLCVHTSSEAHRASYPISTGGKELPGCDADHSPHLGSKRRLIRSLFPLHLAACMAATGQLLFILIGYKYFP